MDEMVKDKTNSTSGMTNHGAHRLKVAWYNRNYIIDPATQVRTVLIFTSIGLISALSVGFLAYQSLHLIKGFVVTADPAYQNLIQIVIDGFMHRLIAMMVVTVLIFTAVGALITHRMAGPIWKLQSVIEKFLEGKPVEPLSFRKGDDFQELPPLINELMKGYKNSKTL